MNPLQKVRLKVFDYIEQLECFVINKEFQKLTKELGITEWTEVVWMGRFFTLDNDYGEHWFDNWELREELTERAEALGYDDSELLIIDPARMANGKDGPCHTPEERKSFWFDVLYGLEISLQTLFNECRRFAQEYNIEFAAPDQLTPTTAELKIEEITNRYTIQ